MSDNHHHYIPNVRKLPRTLLAFTVLTLIYVVLTITLPPNSPTINAYHLSVAEYHVLTLLVSIPVIAVWFAAFYGYARLQEYASLVGNAPDGKPLGTVAKGLRVLAWGLPVSNIITSAFGGIVHSKPGLGPTAFIIVHYLSLVISLVAFTYIGAGSRALAELTKVKPTLLNVRWFLAGITVLGVVFSYATITAGQAPGLNPYFLPMWLILFTILVPYLFAWYMGLWAAYEIYLYGRSTRGVLYRRALGYLALGILITIIVSILIQFLQSDTTRLRRITLNWIFLGVYALLMLYAGGFLLITTGVKKLRKIEEV